MDISESLSKSVALANNTNAVPDATFKKLLENCFSVLQGGSEIHNVSTLYNSKPDLIKELYACLLSLTAQFVRQNVSKEDVEQFLSNKCSYTSTKCKLFCEMYQQFKPDIEMSLVNIGSYLPHITDVNWKIDYIIKLRIFFYQLPSNIPVTFAECYEENLKLPVMFCASYMGVTCNAERPQHALSSFSMDESDGPLFRISLQTEKYDQETQKKKIDFINFTCNSQELQDLVYKLKDAVRHCQRLATDH